MKLLKKEIIAKNQSGRIELQPDEDEDMWHLYNIIRAGDSIKTTTIRKVKREGATGSVSTNKMTISIIIKVEKVNFEADVCKLRVSGKTIGENEHVPKGSYHTIEIEAHKKFSLTKFCWDTIVMEALEEACDTNKKADLAAVIMQDGLAHICLVLNSMTILKSKVEISIPKKRKGFTNQHDKGMIRFYRAVLRDICTKLDFEQIKCLLIASPGFVRDEFYKFAITESEPKTSEFRVFFENKNKILKVHSSDGYKHSLREVLAQPEVARQLADTKAASELNVLNEFYEKLTKAPEWACYGPNEVRHAFEEGAISTLLISDTLFRHSNAGLRKRYLNFVEGVRNAGGKVFKFSSLHVTGERLNSLTGIAALLRFPLEFDVSSDESLVNDC